MAYLASAAFMAATGLYGTNLDKIDCSDVLAAILLKDTAILGEIPMGPPVANIEHFWIEDELNAVSFTGYTTSSVGLIVQTPTTMTALKKIIRTGAVCIASGGDWLFSITTFGASVTATSAIASYGNTSGSYATCATGTKFYVVGQPYSDIVDASSDISTARSRRKNYTQIFERSIAINETRKHIDLWAVKDELAHQINLRTLEIKRELNMAVILGYAYWSGSVFTPDIERRTMAGIIQYMRDYDLDATAESDCVTDVSAALTETNLNTACANLYDKGGLGEGSNCIIVTAPKQARVIAGFTKDRLRVTPNNRVAGFYNNVFLTDLGHELRVVVDRWMPADKLLILDKSRVAIRPLAGDTWHLEKLAKTGRNEKHQLSGQYTMELKCADKAHYLMDNLS